MHPLLKDAFKIQIETGSSVKNHLLKSQQRLSKTIARMEQSLPGFGESLFKAELKTLEEDLEGGIEMLEMLCDEMGRLFQFVPESEECPEPETLK